MKPNGDGTKRVRFGAYEVDGAAHELRKRGVKVRVQEQPWEVLRALLERPGELVTREELQKRLWPDGTFVDFEQSLNKAVTKLRDALCDDADKPRYIETVPRKGYRFIGAIDEDPDPAPAPPVAAPPPPRRRWRWVWWIAGALAAGALAAATLVTGLWPVPAPQVVRIVQLTNDGRPKSVPLVTDGVRVFYGSQDKEIWEVPVGGGQPRQLALPFLGDRLGATFARMMLVHRPPGSGRLALLQFSPLQPQVLDFWTLGMDGSSPRLVASFPASGSFAASPDGAYLAISDSGQMRIVRLDSKLESVAIRPTPTNPGAPWWHPDGRKIGFVHIGKERKEVRVWQVGSDGAGLRRIVPEQEAFQGAGGWSNDGNSFVFFGEDGSPWIRREPSFLGWMRGAVVTRLVPGMFLRGWPSFAGYDSKSILQLGRVARAEIVRFNRRTRTWDPFSAGFTGDCLSYSPDRHWIAYVGFPDKELHVRRVDGSADIVLAPGLQAHNPVWSPDSELIAFSGRSPGSLDQFTVWTVSSKGGALRSYGRIVPNGLDPTWSPDGKRLVFAPYGDPRPAEQWRTQILHVETEQLEDVPGSAGFFSPRWSPNGEKILALGARNPLLWVYDVPSESWRQITSEPIGYPTWSKDSKYVYCWFGRFTQLGRVEVSTGRFEQIAEVKGIQQTNNLGDGQWVGWTPEWEPLVLRDLSTQEVYRIDLDR